MDNTPVETSDMERTGSYPSEAKPDHNTESEPEMTGPWYADWKNWLKIAILLLVLTFIVLAIVFNKTTGAILMAFLDWMEQNTAIGAFAFIALYWFCTVMFIPGSILTLGAGGVFAVIAGAIAGVFLATAVVFAGAAAGASTAFLLGRFVFREKVEAYKSKYEKFDIVDKVVQQQGFKVTLLLRLSPVIPFSAFNYFMGLTGVSFRDYNLAHIGMLPGTLAYCFIGGTIGASGAGFDNPLVLGLTIGGTVLAVVGMVYISLVAKREFAKIAQEQQEADARDEETGDAKPIKTETNSADEQAEESLTMGNM